MILDGSNIWTYILVVISLIISCIFAVYLFKRKKYFLGFSLPPFVGIIYIVILLSGELPGMGEMDTGLYVIGIILIIGLLMLASDLILLPIYNRIKKK